MTPSVDAAGLNELRDFASREFGLKFGEDKQDFLTQTLLRRVELTRSSSVEEYLRSVLPTSDEHQAVSASLTVPETYFFRGGDQLHAFQDLVLPERIRQRRAVRELRILSAGCATGEEPYTISIVLQDSFPELAGWRVGISGYDLVPHHLSLARAARYSTWSMRETSQARRERCFRREGSDFVLKEVYREGVAFREVNFNAPPPDALPPAAFDVIFCRNVIMYFTPDAMASMIRRLTVSLVPGGYLFLGHAETLRGLSSDFALRHTHETFYYQRRDGSEPPAATDGTLPPTASAASSEAAPFPQDTEWVESIRASSDRLEQLYRDLDRSKVATPEAAGSTGKPLAAALELLRRERFQDALQLVAPLAERNPREPEALLLHAVLLIHCGRPSAAETLCAEILRADDTSAETHHLLAICREQAADWSGAVEQDRLAEYLDPEFAMPRLHAGRLHRRQADLAAARRELTQALSLLAREKPLRLLLFGGGFSREALIEHCRTELAAAGAGS